MEHYEAAFLSFAAPDAWGIIPPIVHTVGYPNQSLYHLMTYILIISPGIIIHINSTSRN